MRYTVDDGCNAWLASAMLNPDILMKVLKRFGSARQLYNALCNGDSLVLGDYFEPNAIMRLRASAKLDAMHEMLVALHKESIGIISYDDFLYPDALRNINSPPPFLFYKGNLECLKKNCITIVGTRKASPASIEKTKEIAYDLAKAGVTIVSGLALGIDGAAHRGCLDAGGQTVGLCACGIDVNYPKEHEGLKKEILQKGGLLLSEYPPGIRPDPWHFPARNRIMSGVSSAVVMMECQIRSGSMITVQHALDQGREVFAYPGQSGTEHAQGAHQLLREGANYFVSAEDILSDLGWNRKRVHVSEMKQDKPCFADETPVSEKQKKILSALNGGEQSYDQLAAATGLSASELSGELTMLQLFGIIQALPGKQFMIRNKKTR